MFTVLLFLDLLLRQNVPSNCYGAIDAHFRCDVISQKYPQVFFIKQSYYLCKIKQIKVLMRRQTKQTSLWVRMLQQCLACNSLVSSFLVLMTASGMKNFSHLSGSQKTWKDQVKFFCLPWFMKRKDFIQKSRYLICLKI